MQLILDTKGLQLLRKRNSFLVQPEEGSSRTISPKKLSSIAITQKVMIASDAVVLAIQNEIPILFFDRIGKAQARLWSPYFGSIATLRRQQITFADSLLATAWIIDLLDLKTQGQVDNRLLLAQAHPEIKNSIEEDIKAMNKGLKSMERFKAHPLAQSQKGIMAQEAQIARRYWRAIGTHLPIDYRFDKRSRKPALDLFNACLNYMYGMLYSVVEGALFAAGLDPHLGLLHSDAHAKPVLAFDLIEPVMPWIDVYLIQECMLGLLEEGFATKNQYGLFLNKSGKAHIIPLFNDKLRETISFQGRELSRRSHIYGLAAKLAQRIRSFEVEEDLDREA